MNQRVGRTKDPESKPTTRRTPPKAAQGIPVGSEPHRRGGKPTLGEIPTKEGSGGPPDDFPPEIIKPDKWAMRFATVTAEIYVLAVLLLTCVAGVGLFYNIARWCWRLASG